MTELTQEGALFCERCQRYRRFRYVARRLLDPAGMTVLMVGKTSDILLGDGKHDARVDALAGGPPSRIPLRDPMTMKPMETP